MSFDEDLDAQLASNTQDPDTFTVEILVNGKARQLRFTVMDGLEWAELAAQAPPNLRSPNDKAWGYNLRTMTLLASPKSGRLLDDGVWVELTEEQWKKLLRGQSGLAHRSIANALYTLNEWGPAQAVEAARKASRVESPQKSDSPTTSESPLPDFGDESPESTPDTSTTTTED